ncbi:MAG: histidinol-phosphatase [Pirellulaceae bacterium]
MPDEQHGPTPEDLSARLETALAIARAAGERTLNDFQRGNFTVERKSDNSPVTRADREAEQLMRAAITDRFPRDAIVGEEFGEQPGTSGFTWVLDPIDGTKSFICGVPLYAVLVGIVYDRIGVAGVILIPGLDECVYASQGRGAWYVQGDAEPRAARVSTRERLSDGLFVTSQIDSFAECGARDVYERLEQTAYITRTWGDAYGYLLVATGRAEVMVDPLMNVWDAAAIQPVIVEAGGSFTDWRGEPTIYHGEGVATNAHVRDEVLAITRTHTRPDR